MLTIKKFSICQTLSPNSLYPHQNIPKLRYADSFSKLTKEHDRNHEISTNMECTCQISLRHHCCFQHSKHIPVEPTALLTAGFLPLILHQRGCHDLARRQPNSDLFNSLIVV